VIVVVGYRAREVSAVLSAPEVTVVLNAAFAQGMSTSLKAGIAAIPAAARGALVMLADQPLVSAPFVRQMLAAALDMPEAIIAAVYAGQRGTPVYFPRAYFGELQEISGDEGGRAVLAAHPEHIRLVEASSPLAGTDVDRAGEYEELAAHWDRYSQIREG
jgi:molybdenum cofactor cytidylyltransferase